MLTTASDSPLDQATPSLPLGLNKGTMSDPVAANSSTAQQATDAGMPTTSCTYARPLDPAFAKAYIGTYQKLLSTDKKVEETHKFDETMKNMVVVLMWLKIKQELHVPTQLESEQSLLNGNSPPAASHRSKDKLPAPLLPPLPPPPPSNPPPDALLPQKFPKVYACDMISGLQQLIELALVNQYPLEDAFKISFPNCAYNSKTVYKHKHVFEPHSEEGKWSKLVCDVEILHATANAAQAPLDSSLSSPSDDTSLKVSKNMSNDASLELSMATIQWFSLQHGKLIASYTTDDDSLNTCIEPSPVAKGRIKTVYLVLIPDSVYAIKVINLPSGWWWPQWMSAEDAIWVKAACLNICKFQGNVFMRMATDMEVVIYPFKIYAMHLFTCKGSFHIGQEWISGNHKCDFSAKDSKLCNNTLDALSHYIYQCTGGSTVHVLFQGFQQVQGMAIYDCTTHTWYEYMFVVPNVLV
ncbi:hypothetical protein PTI98_007261 [Pleurotus ostreatus]|nr:hypothetical protein PTI98_007261 [Pleurotus ostreatus]